MSYFLGIDLGTSYFKAGIFDKAGHLKGLGRQYVPKNTDGERCELSIDAFWKTIRRCLDEAIQMAGISVTTIRSISYSTQVNSFILLDACQQPLTPLILWPDKRASGMELPVGNVDELMLQTGLGIFPSTQFAVAKLKWFQKYRSDIWEKVDNILSISDFLTFSFTGQKVCDYSTASMSCLFDIVNNVWWDEQLGKTGIHANMLSVPQKTGAYVGVTTADVTDLVGLPPGIPFFLGGLDHHIAAIGAGIPSNGFLCVSTGTVLSCVDYTAVFLPQKNICVALGLHFSRFFRLIFDDNGASSLEWYQKNYAPSYTIDGLLEMASHIAPGCEGLIARPCAEKFSGLSGFMPMKAYRYQHGHYVRAILESTARSLQQMVAEIKKDSPVPAIVVSGGGSRSELWIEIKSTLLQVPFLIPECTELSCMGAAMIGALGINEFDDYDSLVNAWVRFRDREKVR